MKWRPGFQKRALALRRLAVTAEVIADLGAMVHMAEAMSGAQPGKIFGVPVYGARTAAGFDHVTRATAQSPFKWGQNKWGDLPQWAKKYLPNNGRAQ